jgi:hypothetical protein
VSSTQRSNKLPCNAVALRLGHNLERLDDSGYGLVLETRVFSFGVFTDDGKVYILVSCWKAI